MEENRYSDESDRASAEEERATAEALLRQRMSQKPPPKDWDKLHCYECDSELPKERIVANRYLCVGCKEAEENFNKRYAK